MTALQHALDMIDREFGNRDGRAKGMAKSMLRVGAAHPAARARYAVLATMAADCRHSLDGFLIVLDRLIAEERRKLEWRRYTNHSPLSLEIDKEARLICRWMRRNRPGLWLWVLSALTVPAHSPFMIAAE